MKIIALSLISLGAFAASAHTGDSEKKSECISMLEDYGKRHTDVTQVARFEVFWSGQAEPTYSEFFVGKGELGRALEDKATGKFLETLSPRDQVDHVNLYLYYPESKGQVIQLINIKKRN